MTSASPLAIRPPTTVAFPLAFTSVTLAAVIIQQLIPHDSDANAFFVDGILFAIPLALLAWPGHAVTSRWLNRRTSTFSNRQRIAVSTIAGALVPFSPFVFMFAVPRFIGDRISLLTPVIYWVVAAGITWLVYRLIDATNRRGAH